MPRSFPALLAAMALTLVAPLAAPPARAAVSTAVPVPPPPTLNAASYILVDYDTGQVLAAQNPDEQRAMASLTKLTTAYIVFAALRDGQLTLDTPVNISKAAWRTGGSRMFVDPGTQIPVIDLLKGLIVDSGNDAAVALAQRVGGTRAGFVALMNEYAQRLGLHSTHYADVNGLPVPDHHTTARDLATLTADIIRDFPQYYPIFKIKQFTWDHITQTNRVSLLFTDPSVDGLKTGYTKAAGYCMIVSAKRNGMRLISVVLGAPSWNGRVKDSEALLNYGFSFYKTQAVATARAVVARPRVFKSAAGSAAVGAASTVYLTQPAGRDAQLSSSIHWHHWPLVAPIAAGTVVATETVTNGAGKVVEQIPLVTLEAVPEGGFLTRIADDMRLWF